MLGTSADDIKGIFYVVVFSNGITLSTLVGVVLKVNKIWTRLKDQHQAMYRKYCNEHEIPFQSLNGNGH